MGIPSEGRRPRADASHSGSLGSAPEPASSVGPHRSKCAGQVPDADASPPEPAWRSAASTPSLAQVHRSVPVAKGGSWWRRMFAFAGPGYLVAVGYMDPGNWATDIAGGSAFGYTLLSVILLSNVMAIILQALASGLAWRPGGISRRPAVTTIPR